MDIDSGVDSGDDGDGDAPGFPQGLTGEPILSPLPAKDGSEDHLDSSRPVHGICIRCHADSVEASCTRPDNEPDCVRCKFLGVACAWEQMPQRKSTKPRVLNRLKCDFCRQSKQACLPIEREWNEMIQTKCQRCSQRDLPCSKPSTKSRHSPSRTSDMFTNRGDTQLITPHATLLPPSPTTISSRTDLIYGKKRGRPSKTDFERKQAETISRGEIVAPKIAPGIQLAPEDGLLHPYISPAFNSLKRNRTLTGEEEDSGRVPLQPLPQLQLGDIRHDSGNIHDETQEPRNRLVTTQLEKLPLPAQPLSPANPGSPLRFSTLASDVETASSSRRTSDGPRIERMRARANWFRAADAIRKEYQIKKITNYLSEITWGSSRALCEVCKLMELTADKFVLPKAPNQGSIANENRGAEDNYSLGPQSKRGRVILGKLVEIQKRSYKCPFCKLVLYAAQEQTEIDLSEGRSHPDLACFASWQLDGYEIERGKWGSVARTRRIRLHWTGIDFHDSYIVLVAKPGGDVKSNLFLGRELKLGRDDPPIDILPSIKGWIDVCSRNHGHKCGLQEKSSSEEMRRKSYFKVIDTWNMELTSLPSESRYAALSYTWGKAAAFAPEESHIPKLQTPNGVQKFLQFFPTAVKQAIELVRNLGERYIWVDSLCIIRDSKNSFELNLNMMDQIYGNAHFTICAADNPDATVGLVALDLSKRRAAQQLKQRIELYAPGVKLMVARLMESYIRKTRWSTRAWTFQERILSRRCLIFAQGQVFFQCRSTAMSEDIWSDSPIAGWSIELSKSPQQFLSLLQDRPLHTYAKLIEKYTACALDSNHKDDILMAFRGLSNVLGKAMNSFFIHGMPDIYFDWALLWEPRHYPQRRLAYRRSKRMDLKGAKSKQVANFPSWSWCGWLGIMQYTQAVCSLYPYDLNEWFIRHTWIIWYIRDSQGRLRLVRQPPHPPNRKEGDTRREGSEIAHLLNPELDMYGRVLRYPHHGGISFTKTLPGYSMDKANPQEKLDPLQRDLKYLQFWTWSANFSLFYEEADKSKRGHGHGLRRFEILDNKGDWCGTMVLRQDWVGKIKEEPIQKFIAISDAMGFSPDEHDSWNYYVPNEREASAWDLFYVLLIEEDEEGVSRRAGLGKVFMEAFEYSYRGGKQWSEIILG